MKKFKHDAGWFCFNFGIAYMLYLGLECKEEGMRNIALFLIWMMLPMSIIVVFAAGVSSDEDKANLFEFHTTFVNLCVGLAFTLFLAWHGYLVTAGAYAVSVFFSEIAAEMCNSARNRLKEESKNKDKEKDKKS
jgi:hypothetical protein